MKKPLLRAGTGACLLVAALFFLGDVRNAAAVLLAVFIHEAGHLLALWALGLPLRGLRVELRGLCIEYGGSCGACAHALAAAAGPLAGLAFAFAVSRIGNRLGSDWCCLAAGASLLLSVFNLLPAMPLDGGMILFHLSAALLGHKRAGAILEAAGLIVGAGLMGGGLYLMLHGKGAALLLAAIWLLLAQEDARGLVKRQEMI